MRIVVTGGAGFIGSHLCRALLERGDRVVAVDNFCTGRRQNLEGLGLEVIEHDLCRPLQVEGPVDAVLNLASPASPPAYQSMPLETLEVGSAGTRNALDLAREHGARFLLASTSEIYGDPEEHPQREEYRGYVNPIGPRSMYDEAKRYAEALTVAYGRVHGVSVGIVRIFNTYGPRMLPDDGRVVTNFLSQALAGGPLTVYGKGLQTRSFCYVSDLVRGLITMADSFHSGPVNLGNPGEFTMLELAREVQEVTGQTVQIEFRPLPEDDPRRRCPDITRARQLLGWEPTVPLREGLRRTWEWLVATSRG